MVYTLGQIKAGSNPTALSFVGLGIIMLLLFIIVELRVENPLLHLRAFAIPEFTKGISLMWLRSNRCFRGHASCPTLTYKMSWTFF